MATVLLAIENTIETDRFATVADLHGIIVHHAGTVGEVETLLEHNSIDVIITDLQFQSGGFAEWLILWQHPFILLAAWSEYQHISEIVTTGTSDFVIRDEMLRHIDFLPLVIKRILNNKESIDRHNLSIRMTEERYHELVQAVPDIVYTLDSAGRFVFVNDSVRRLGWNPMDLIGNHFSLIIDPAYVDQITRSVVLAKYRGTVTGPELAPKLFDERRSGTRKTTDLEVKLRRKDDAAQNLFGSVTAFGEVNAVGFSVFGGELEDPGTVGIIRDVTQRIESNRIIRRSLKEKETLLAEVHHRVKNNLQIVSSLLHLQQATIEDRQLQVRFTDAEMRIQSMALVHEHLYQNENFGAVDTAEYIRVLSQHLYEAYGVPVFKVELFLNLMPIMVPMSTATPLALLLNELISNSLKYAFPGESHGTLSITLTAEEQNRAALTVEDNGVGMPEGFDITGSPSLGHTLIYNLVQQMHGEIQFGGENGTRFCIVFPVPE